MPTLPVRFRTSILWLSVAAHAVASAAAPQASATPEPSAPTSSDTYHYKRATTLLKSAPAPGESRLQLSAAAGVGFWVVDPFRKGRTSADGTSSSVDTQLPFSLSFHGTYGRWGLSQFNHYTVFGRDGIENTYKSRILATGLLFAFIPGESFNVHLGPGLMWTFISGPGGTAILNNGGGSTAFGLPSQSATARFATAVLGTSLWTQETNQVRVRLDIDLIGTSIGSSRRAVDGLASLNIELGVIR